MPTQIAAFFCRGMSRYWLEENLGEAIVDLECALEGGLEGDRRAQAEEALAELRERRTAPITVSMGPVACGEGLTDDGELVNPGTAFPADSLREIWCRWDLHNPTDEETVVKWYHDGELVCQHETELEDWWEWSASGWTAEEEWVEPGRWCVAVYIFDEKMTEGCFAVE